MSTCLSHGLSSVGDDVVAVVRNFHRPPLEQQEEEEEEQEHVDFFMLLSVGRGVGTVRLPSVEEWCRRSNADVGRRTILHKEISCRWGHAVGSIMVLSG